MNITWKNTLNCNLTLGYGHIENAYNKAKQLGYAAFSFNRRIYFVGSQRWEDTGFYDEDLDAGSVTFDPSKRAKITFEVVYTSNEVLLIGIGDLDGFVKQCDPTARVTSRSIENL